MDRPTRQLVHDRAGLRCEYCQLPQLFSPLAKFQVEHIRPLKHGGDDDVNNLALACIDCNLRKGPNLSGIDPQTDAIASLYDPRRDKWDDHFRWDGMLIVGITGSGRATIAVMALNSLDRLQVRLAMTGTGDR